MQRLFINQSTIVEIRRVLDYPQRKKEYKYFCISKISIFQFSFLSQKIFELLSLFKIRTFSIIV